MFFITIISDGHFSLLIAHLMVTTEGLPFPNSTNSTFFKRKSETFSLTFLLNDKILIIPLAQVVRTDLPHDAALHLHICPLHILSLQFFVFLLASKAASFVFR